MKKLLFSLLLAVPMLGYAEGWEVATGPESATTDGVQPVTAGLIAVSAPANNSADDIGVKFVDPSTIPGLKGAVGPAGQSIVGPSGSVGATGAASMVAGPRGQQGTAGLDGSPGKDAREVTQVGVMAEVDLVETPRYTAGLFGFYDAAHNQVAQGGIILRFRPFKSSLEKRIDALEKRLAR